MILQCVTPMRCYRVPRTITVDLPPCKSSSSSSSPETIPATPPPSSKTRTTRRGALSLSLLSALISILPPPSSSSSAISDFSELPNSGGVRALDLRLGSGELPSVGDQVAIHYYGRLAAKQGWRFDSTYDHKDEMANQCPLYSSLAPKSEFSNQFLMVISGIEAAVRSMKVGGIRRVIIPPSQGYQNTSQEPLPPNFFDRQRLFTTIFNPTRLANGEGSTLGTLLFDIELVSLRHQ